MSPSPKQRVLVSPLEWGLGHATRLSRMIEILLEKKLEVIIAADGLPYNFLSEQFPDLTLVRLPIKQMRYSKGRNGFFLKFFAQLPRLFLSIHRTKKHLDKLIKDYQIDFIISDNRYGFFHSELPSVFITHQLSPMPPEKLRFFQAAFAQLHLWILRKYDYIWVADFEGSDNVAGKLSRMQWNNNKIRYIDPLSWLETKNPAPDPLSNHYDILIMLSGPEPHRGILEEKLLTEFRDTSKSVLLLQGLPQQSKNDIRDEQIGKMRIVNHLPGGQILWHIQNTETIICRAGVVTVFDLAVLKKSALLIPTPGQTEQEYVAERLDKMGFFMSVKQEDFSKAHLREHQKRSYKTFQTPEKKHLESALAEFIEHPLSFPPADKPGQVRGNDTVP
ncbi:MAG: glycosyltransferase [Bacteroidota bacterium]|nr:glycosyltransferase [Bacteroidota bacterium]